MTHPQPVPYFRSALTVSILTVLLVLGGCASRAATSKTEAALSASSASYIAALDGGIIGRNAAVKLRNADRQRALEAEYSALEAAPGGQPVVWQGAGAKGSVVATAPYQVGSQNCRQYSHTVTVGTGNTVMRGVACRNANGTWTPLT